MLELSIKGSMMVARSRKAMALEALREIQETFKRSGITERDILEAGRKTRRKAAR